MTPNHDLFRTIFSLCQKSVDTFDYLPNADTAYPFIYVAENSDRPSGLLELSGELSQTLHLYALRTQRQGMDKIIVTILQSLREAVSGSEYHFRLIKKDVRTFPDNTDVQPLLHAVVDVGFYYTKKES